MNAIGLFEAKTKFSAICDQVATRGLPVVVTRRGKPLVRIVPIHPAGVKPKSVWDNRADYVKINGPLTGNFALPRREKQTWRNPLGD